MDEDSKKEINWEIEPIPDEDELYIFVHKSSISKKVGNKKKIHPNAFRNTPFNTGTDLSSDWSYYATPQETRNNIGTHKKINRKTGEDLGFKNPEDYFVLKILVSDVRHNLSDEIKQRVIHDPIQNDKFVGDNRAHTKIEGNKDLEIRTKMIDLCEWAISPPEYTP